MMFIEVEGAKIYLVDEGQGQPVLFLHGNPDSADLWGGVIAQLKDKYRCLAIDLPGFGRSAAPAWFDGTLASEERFVDALVRALDISQPLDIVGHDFGGHFALAWAIKHPAKVGRVVLSNTSFFADYQWHGMGRVWRTPLLGELSMAALNEGMLVRSLRAAAPALSVEQVQHTFRLYPPTARKMALRLYRAANPPVFQSWEAGLRTLAAQVPIMVLWGDQDPYAAARYAERFGAREVHHFPEFSHWLPAEAPAAFAQKLDAFFSAQPTPLPATAGQGAAAK